MLPVKTVLYVGVFCAAVLAAVLYNPVVGVLAYLATYNVSPWSQWWGKFIPDVFDRYSLILACATGVGLLLHHAKFRYRKLLESQELIYLLFVCMVVFSTLLDQAPVVHMNAVKMFKIPFILLFASHLVITTRYYEMMLWTLILSGMYLGIEMHSGAGEMFDGRFQGGIGGSDFVEGNFLAAHFAALLPFVGVMFIKGNWKIKTLCGVVAVFIINGIALTRSRGAFLALGMGGLVFFLSTLHLRQYRTKFMVLMVLGGISVFSLMDFGFWDRMDTINTQGEERDISAQRRLDAWKVAFEIAKDHPLGIGVSKFSDYVGLYNPDIEGMDTHNTYLRCLAELGFQGLFFLGLLIYNAFRTINGIMKQLKVSEGAYKDNYVLYCISLRVSLVVYLTAAAFISSVYIEELYWLLLMPVFLKRSFDNEFHPA